MGGSLPATGELEGVSRIARMCVDKAREDINGPLGTEITFSESEWWRCRVHVYEEDAPTDDQQHWYYKASEEELRVELAD